MAALSRFQMFAQLVPTDIHQHHGIQGILGIPRRGGRVRRLPSESKLRGNKRVLAQAVDAAELLADVIMKRHVDTFEIAVANKVGPADELLFRRRAEYFQRAL